MESSAILLALPVVAPQIVGGSIRCDEIERSPGRFHVNAQQVFTDRTKYHENYSEKQGEKNHYRAPAGQRAKKYCIEQET
jgi:hypothetical protein